MKELKDDVQISEDAQMCFPLTQKVATPDSSALTESVQALPFTNHDAGSQASLSPSQHQFGVESSSLVRR